MTQTVSRNRALKGRKKNRDFISQRCSSYIICPQSGDEKSGEERKGGGKGEGGYGSIDRELGRYDIIVTNIESILYYCTSIFVIINPNRVTRSEMERGRQK